MYKRQGEDLAAMVAETGAVMDAVAAVTDDKDANVRECAAALLREVACKTADLAEKVASDGGIAGLVQCLAYDRGDKRSMFAAQTLGYIADYKPSLAMAVVGVDRGRCLIEALDSAPDADSATAAAWAIGCVARHGKESAAPLAKSGALKSLTDTYARAGTNEALRDRCKASVKSVIKNSGAGGSSPLSLHASNIAAASATVESCALIIACIRMSAPLVTKLLFALTSLPSFVANSART